MKKKIRNVLDVIKQECNEHLGQNYDCEGCGFRMKTGGCFLGMNPEIPYNWNLKELEDDECCIKIR